MSYNKKAKEETMRRKLNLIRRTVVQKCDEASQIKGLDPKVEKRLNEMRKIVEEEILDIKNLI